jgi:hypothetical protein
MESKNEHLESLKEIRAIMEKSSQFLSLSGLSGVFIGLVAIMGAFSIYLFKYDFFFGRYYDGGVFVNEQLLSGKEYIDFLVFSSIIGIIVLVLAITFGIIFTARNARIKGLPLWSSSARRMLINLFIPLIAGGLFCIALLYHRLIYLIAPATLIFYGLALVNAGKYTLKDIRYLGIIEIALGILATFMVGYGLIFWSLGFGVLHIAYGLTMYWKYERVNK